MNSLNLVELLMLSLIILLNRKKFKIYKLTRLSHYNCSPKNLQFKMPVQKSIMNSSLSESLGIPFVIKNDKFQVRTSEALLKLYLLLDRDKLRKYFQDIKTYNMSRSQNSEAKFVRLTIKFD